MFSPRNSKRGNTLKNFRNMIKAEGKECFALLHMIKLSSDYYRITEFDPVPHVPRVMHLNPFCLEDNQSNSPSTSTLTIAPDSCTLPTTNDYIKAPISKPTVKTLKPLSSSDLDLKSQAALDNIDLDSHIRSQIIRGRKLLDNNHFTKQVYTADAEDLPCASKGLYALARLP